MGTVAELVHARADDDAPGLLFEDQAWTWRQWVAEASARAHLFDGMRLDGPPNIGLLLENVPDFSFWLGAAALARATIVGINPTRRGAELARDITHTDCQLIVTERSMVGLLDGLDPGAATGRVLVVDDPAYEASLAPHRGASLPEATAAESDRILLLFTSGTSGSPKAVICTQGRLARMGAALCNIFPFTAADRGYEAMPLFHSNALFTAWAPSLTAGFALVLKRRFSASAFIDDVRRYGCTYFNYVGKPLAYILATPERPDDRDHSLKWGFGNEANDADIARFAERFGVPLTDGYGQSETGASISRVPGMPSGALGVAGPDVKVFDPDGNECPRARFDADGRLLNADEAIGEIVNTGASGFEGYYNNPEADAERRRGGTGYWTGDLAYRDDAGFFYFAGRTADWLRVDGENFAAAPIERIVMRDPSVILAAVYGVPDPVAGDQVMVAIQIETPFDPVAFDAHLAAQGDLGPKWTPRFVRVARRLPMTETLKVIKRQLVHERWDADDELWWRPAPGQPLVRFDAAAADELRARFTTAGRADVLNR